MVFTRTLYSDNHGQIHWDSTAFYLSNHFLSHILGSFGPPPPHTMLLGENKRKIVCRAESGPVYAQH